MKKKWFIVLLIIIIIILIIIFLRTGCLLRGSSPPPTVEEVQVETKTEAEPEEKIPAGTELESRIVNGYEQVTKGMSKEQVRGIMGNSDQESFAWNDDFGNTEVWTYVSKGINYDIIFFRGSVVKKQKG